MELGGGPQKMDEHSAGFHGLSRLVSKNIASDGNLSFRVTWCFFNVTPTTGAVEQ